MGAELARRQPSRHHHPVEFHVGKPQNEIAVLLKDGRVARRAAVKKGQRLVNDAGIRGGAGHPLALRITAAGCDKRDGMAKARQIAARH